MQDSDQEKSKEVRCVECGKESEEVAVGTRVLGRRCSSCVTRLHGMTLQVAEKPQAAIYQGYKERIVCAALRHRVTGSVICGPRHFDPVMHNQIKLTGLFWKDADQGFVDQWGRFWDRTMALEIVKASQQEMRQPPSTCIGGQLHSEDLY